MKNRPERNAGAVLVGGLAGFDVAPSLHIQECLGRNVIGGRQCPELDAERSTFVDGREALLVHPFHDLLALGEGDRKRHDPGDEQCREHPRIEGVEAVLVEVHCERVDEEQRHEGAEHEGRDRRQQDLALCGRQPVDELADFLVDEERELVVSI